MPSSNFVPEPLKLAPNSTGCGCTTLRVRYAAVLVNVSTSYSKTQKNINSCLWYFVLTCCVFSTWRAQRGSPLSVSFGKTNMHINWNLASWPDVAGWLLTVSSHLSLRTEPSCYLLLLRHCEEVGQYPQMWSLVSVLHDKSNRAACTVSSVCQSHCVKVYLIWLLMARSTWSNLTAPLTVDL